MKRLITFAASLLLATAIFAEKVEITSYKINSQKVITPFIVDSTDVNGKRVEPAKDIYRISFDMRVKSYSDVAFSIENASDIKISINGENSANNINLTPNIYSIDICFNTDSLDSVRLYAESKRDGIITIPENIETKHLYTTTDVLQARRVSSASISPSGKFALITTSKTLKGGKSETIVKLVNLLNNTSHKLPSDTRFNWMPKSDKYYYTRERKGYRELITVDPITGNEEIVTALLPKSGSITISPTEDWILLSDSETGPKEVSAEMYQVLTPEDRQPGWRNRSNIIKFDIATGECQPLTYGHSNIRVYDISSDGQSIIFAKKFNIFTQRPTEVNTFYLMNVTTFEVKEIISQDGFVADCNFSPDGKNILITGSPEALGGIGKCVLEDQIPSTYDYQLFIMSVEDGSIKTMTKDFDPSIETVIWKESDNTIYFTASDKDSVNFFSLNPISGKIVEIAMPEEMVNHISIASNANSMLWYGNSVSNSDRIYFTNLKNKQTTLIEDISAENLKDVIIGQSIDWTYITSRGDKIYARYYVPFDFDPQKQYPLIVNYYGGCTPESRSFESRYPEHSYTNLGYIFLEITPSGAIGFGQEFSARHVNTAGKIVAEDIIEGVEQFCAQFNFVNKDRIGCIGASYGGFMTQYLLTQTDIFATGISHAGISDHTSYWGEGYWGYSYSETCMAESYPWTRKDLYVDQSPLFNADKIHTPLLLLHGDSDTNVPPGESIQMFNALTLLGRDVALVFAKNQNHHVLDFDTRIRWEQTIYAWFAKYLQDDSSWWDSMYPPKQL